MALKIERRTLNDAAHKIDVANNLSKTGLKIDLPMDRWIKKVRLILKAQYDASGAPTLNEDNPMSLLGNVAIVANGKAIRDVPFSMLHYKNIYDNYGRVPPRVRSNESGAVNNKLCRAVADFDFCTEPSFPNEHIRAVDAMLPAHKLNSLHVRVDTGAVADLASNTTLDSAEVHVMLEEAVFKDEDDEEKLFGKNLERLTVIQESTAEKTITQASNYQFEIDLPSGNILRRSMLKAVDNSVRSDSIVTEFRTVVKSLGIEDQWSWEMAQIDDRIGLGIGNKTDMGELEASSTTTPVYSLKGIVMNDYRDLGYLNLRGARAGAAKIQFNTGSPTATSKIVALHEELLSGAEALGRL